MRGAREVLAVAALLVLMVVASAAPAFAQGFNDFVNEDIDINCPVVGVIVDNSSAFNNSC